MQYCVCFLKMPRPLKGWYVFFYGVSLLYRQNVHLIIKKKKKMPILCLFLKNASPSNRVVCFILNYLHFPMNVTKERCVHTVEIKYNLSRCKLFVTFLDSLSFTALRRKPL